MPTPETPPDDPCARTAPLVARALRDHGWREIRLACRDGELHVAARCPGEPAESPPGHAALGAAAVAALAATLPPEATPDAP
jgi:hypothetical protein